MTGLESCLVTNLLGLMAMSQMVRLASLSQQLYKVISLTHCALSRLIVWSSPLKEIRLYSPPDFQEVGSKAFSKCAQ